MSDRRELLNKALPEALGAHRFGRALAWHLSLVIGLACGYGAAVALGIIGRLPDRVEAWLHWIFGV